MKNLYLIRGIPGSGKSTFGKSLCSNKIFDKHIEADQYFVDKNGNYNWNIHQLHQAHIWCKDQVELHMNKNFHKIVVTNTFTKEADLQPYYELAIEYGYQVFSIILENRHYGLNQHDIPAETINKMESQLRNSIRLN